MACSDVSEYLRPSTVGMANFVSVRPCVEGDGRSTFKIWKKQMLCLLESQEVAGFVDGGTPPPPEDEERQKKMWRRSDLLVQGWILGSIGKDALDIVWDKPTAREMWLELETIFKEQVQQEHGRKEEDEEKEKEEGEGESEKDKGGVDGDFRSYSPLYQAAMRGDWNTAESFFSDINELSKTIISSKLQTTLHAASLTGKSNLDFVKKLVELMPPEALALQDSNGDTALHITAIIGNTEAAKAMVIKNPDLLYILNDIDRLPVHEAAINSQKETLEYLLSEHEKFAEDKPLFEGQTGINLLIQIIGSEFVDIALDLVHKYPNLALLMEEEKDNRTALSTTSQTPSLFVRIETLSWWHKFIYHRIPVKKSLYVADTTSQGRDVESLCSQKKNYSNSFQLISQVGLNKLEILMWHVIENLVPNVKGLREKKAQHQRALQLVQFLCNKIASSPQNNASTIFRKSAYLAVEEGISEIVEMIIQKYPDITFERDSVTGKHVFLIAATYRFENVINILYSMSDRKYLSYDNRDYEGNNLMHICGKLAPSHRLNLVAGAALQMQRELQWFKGMEEFVSPSRRTWPNKEKLTPQQIFTEEHKQLKAEGERWMKDTANACTIAAALIATVMFAAAFTLPGGLDSSTGIPLLSGKPPFMLFAISDAISLFASINSLLMFLSILTSRYAEEDFLYVLPKRLSMGLLSLFVSITFMMVAFSATLYLVFRREVAWFFVLLAAFACFPVTSFVLLQFPLLVEVLYSTYGPGIFGKKSNRILY